MASEYLHDLCLGMAKRRLGDSAGTNEMHRLAHFYYRNTRQVVLLVCGNVWFAAALYAIQIGLDMLCKLMECEFGRRIDAMPLRRRSRPSLIPNDVE
jgi:hypothetical protein